MITLEMELACPWCGDASLAPRSPITRLVIYREEPYWEVTVATGDRKYEPVSPHHVRNWLGKTTTTRCQELLAALYFQWRILAGQFRLLHDQGEWQFYCRKCYPQRLRTVGYSPTEARGNDLAVKGVRQWPDPPRREE